MSHAGRFFGGELFASASRVSGVGRDYRRALCHWKTSSPSSSPGIWKGRGLNPKNRGVSDSCAFFRGPALCHQTEAKLCRVRRPHGALP